MMTSTKCSFFLAVSICYFLFFWQNTDGMILSAQRTVISTIPGILTKSGIPISNNNSTFGMCYPEKSLNSDRLSSKLSLQTINLTSSSLDEQIKRIVEQPSLIKDSIKWLNENICSKIPHTFKVNDAIENHKAVDLFSSTQYENWIKKVSSCAVLYAAFYYANTNTHETSSSNKKAQKKQLPTNDIKPDISHQNSENDRSSTTPELKPEEDPKEKDDKKEETTKENRSLSNEANVNEDNIFKIENKELQEKLQEKINEVKKIDSLLKIAENKTKEKNQEMVDLKSKTNAENQRFCRLAKIREGQIEKITVDLEKKIAEVKALEQQKTLQDTQLNNQENIITSLSQENTNLHSEKQLLQEEKRSLEELQKQSDIIKERLEKKLEMKKQLLENIEQEKARLLETIQEREKELLNNKNSIQTLNHSIIALKNISESERENSKALQAKNDELHGTIKCLKENLDFVKKEQEIITELLNCVTQSMEEEKREEVQSAHETTEEIKKVISQKITTIKKEIEDIQSSFETVTKMLEEDALHYKNDAVSFKQKYDWTKYLLCLAIVGIAAFALDNMYLHQQNASLHQQLIQLNFPT